MPLPAYINVWQLIEMFSSILRISVSACIVITPQRSLFMQPRHFAIAYLCLYPSLYPYAKKLLMGKSCVVQLYIQSCAYLPSSGLIRRVIWRFIKQSVSTTHESNTCMTLQELLTNNTKSLIRDSNKIAKHSQVIKMSVKFELSCTVSRIS